MLVSIDWLNDYVDVKDLYPSRIADLLTDLGHEVESLEEIKPLDKGVRVGKVLTCEPVEGSKKLSMCQVDVGEVEPLPIVCGAANVCTGLIVAVATPGCLLPGGLRIQRSQVKGIDSHGMLCSEDELGLAEKSDGILSLPVSWKIGASLEDMIHVEDTILDVSLTANRGDCLGMIGVARELAAKLERPLKVKDREYSRSQTETTDVKVHVDACAPCSRFTATSFSNLPKNSESPLWMKKRLTRAGMRPVSLVVDVANYTMLETNQPVHTYDRSAIRGHMLIIRGAHQADELKTLDGQTPELVPGDVLVCDSEKPLGLAGVMGGESSEVHSQTESMVLEVASFTPGDIRKTARRLSLHSEASHRFERGIDAHALVRVAESFGGLLQSVCAELGLAEPVMAKETVDSWPGQTASRKIALRISRARSLLHLPVLTAAQCSKNLEAMGFACLDGKDDRLVYDIPTWRNDIHREVDLIEEVGRLYGLNKISGIAPQMSIEPGPEDPYLLFVEALRAGIAKLGLNEVMTFPFANQKDFSNCSLHKEHPLWPEIELQNAIQHDARFLQTSLMPSMLKVLKQNASRGVESVKAFQIARGYWKSDFTHVDWEKWGQWSHLKTRARFTTELMGRELNRPIEKHLLSGLLGSPYRQQSWDQKSSEVSFFDGKSLLLSLFKGFKWDVSCEDIDADQFPYLHPHASAVLAVGGQVIGWFGLLHPQVCQNWGIELEQAPLVFEVDLEMSYLAGRKQEHKGYAAPNPFPAVRRDLAVVVDKNMVWGSMDRVLQGFPDKKFLSKWRLFDVYSGDSIEDGKQSFAMNLEFVSTEKTLTDKLVDKEFKSLLAWLSQEAGASLR